MANVTLETKGSAPDYAKTVEVNSKRIADQINELYLDGSKVRDNDRRIDLVDQSFVDRHGIKAYYVSGTFMSFTLCQAAVEEFENF